MAGVFISYRRSDTAPYAARLKVRLDSEFGDGYVFMDVDSLRPGEPFPKVIEQTIASTEAVLALIGPDWLTVTGADGRRRLDNPGDFVRIELATAFRQGRVVIPVLLENASMPHAVELPEPLAALAERHAIELGDKGWDGDVARLVQRLEEVVDTIPPRPYPGMVAFGRADAARFFGREKEVGEIEDRLASQRFLCLVGPSGCGKSSLIAAGVLADLERTQAVRWAVRTMRPGGAPMRSLGEALGAELDHTATPEAVGRAAGQAIASQQEAARLLLVVDQLEELFAQAGSDEQARFVAALEAIHEVDEASIVLAIRADFYGELMESALWPLVEGGKVDVPPLTGDALAEAIVEPAKACHVTIEPDLLERLLADAGNEPGALPLLQEALVRLWGSMHLHRISLAAYEQIGEGRGGLSAAVAETADAALAALSPKQVSIAKRVLLRLVQFGQGRPDTRRRLAFEDLRSEGDDDRALEEVLDSLARSRLVTLAGSATPGAGGELVDLAHEALIAGWPTMREWLAERRDAEQARRRLEGHVATWEEHDRTAAFLDEVELREAQGWLAGPDARELGVPRGLPELVAVSAAKLRRRRRLRRAAIAGLAGLLIAAIVLAGVFLRARNDAIHRANVALSRERAAGALAALSVDPHHSLRLALQAVDALRADRSATAADRQEAEAALRDAVRASRVRALLKGHTAEVVSAHFDASGRRVVTAGWDGTARVWDARTGRAEAVMRTGAVQLETAAFDPDGTRVITAQDDGTARVWNAGTGAPLAVLRHEPRSKVLDAGFSADGRFVVTAGSDGTARVWDASTWRPETTLGRVGGPEIRRAVFSRDGSLVATAGRDGFAVVWSTSTGRSLARLRHGAAVGSVRFGPDRSIVTASDDGTARVWCPFAREAKPVVLRGHQGVVTDAEFSPDGTRVVTASLDGTARLWSPRTGEELTVPLTHGGAVRTATFSPDGTRVVTASADQTARIWDARTGKEHAALRGHDNYVGSAEFSPDGTRVLTSSFDDTARVWDAAEEEPLVTVGSSRFPVARAALSPDGKRFVTTPSLGDPRVLDAGTGAAVSTLAVDGARVVSAEFSADGRDVVTAEAGSVRIWAAATGRLVGSKELKGDPVVAVPSPDAAAIVSVSVDDSADRSVTTVALWNRTRPEPAATWHLDGRGQGADFDANGRRLVVWSEDGGVSVWDIPSRRRLAAFSIPTALRSASLSPDGSRVVTAGNDGIARIWDVASGGELKSFSHALAVVAASFSADGSRLLTAGLDQTAKIWDAQTGDELVSLKGHESELAGATFSAGDRWVVTAGLDETARTWDALTGQELAVFQHPAAVTEATFDRDGRRVLTLAADFRARVFRCDTCLSLDGLVRLARSRLVAGLQ